MHLTGLSVHAVHDSERLELIAQIADNTAALLETLLHGDADALNRTASLCQDGDQALQRTAVCQKIVDNKHMVVRTEKLLRNDNLILALMRKGFNLGNINLAVDVDALGLFRKHDRNAEMTCHNAGNANTGCLNGNDIVDKQLSQEGNFGFDAKDGKFVDMYESGIVDPCKVTRSAILNAASISGLLITTEAAVGVNKEKNPAPAMPDMGGMY